ncbi:unnamed protein product [Schistocephalus solidus]|uniref:Cu2_monooxygen domain-containing protein n=1 Tax=Schistocephalus solidus TaxID=70667 RepID=A0A183TD63_SCHSO|nr:unnamed protein product [Schistocephalus solidus]
MMVQAIPSVFFYEGEYGFEIYANEPEDGKAFTHICQYLIHYEAPPGWTPPDTGRGYSLPVSSRSGASSVNSLEEREGNSRVLLRDMHNYGSEAPSIGQLPRPYACSQYAGAQVCSLAFAVFLSIPFPTYLARPCGYPLAQLRQSLIHAEASH